jgi:hypothetical protein
MTRQAVTYHDPERATVDILGGLVDTPVGVSLPAKWTPRSGPFLTVAWDGTPQMTHPISMAATIRVVAWSGSKTEAKAIALDAMGRLAAHIEDGPVVNFKPLLGPMPASDPDHEGAELCAFTMRATTRSTPITN